MQFCGLSCCKHPVPALSLWIKQNSSHLTRQAGCHAPWPSQDMHDPNATACSPTLKMRTSEHPQVANLVLVACSFIEMKLSRHLQVASLVLVACSSTFKMKLSEYMQVANLVLVAGIVDPSQSNDREEKAQCEKVLGPQLARSSTQPGRKHDA